MVEYAILLILLATLFVGGTELGLTSLASSKNTEAAKTGISEYAEVNQQRLNLINAVTKHSTNLSTYCPLFWYKIEDRNLDGNNDVLLRCSSSTDSLEDNGYTKTDYLTFLLRFQKGEIIPDYDLIDYQQIDHESEDGESTPPEGFSVNDLLSDPNSDNNLSDTEINQAELNESTTTYSTDQENAGKEMRLINIQLLKLARLPLFTDIDGDDVDDISLTQAEILIGDPDTGIVPASCNGNNYNYGFPNGRYPYNNDNDDQIFVKTVGGQLYLFHPFPIDVSSCVGTDDTRGGRSRLRILIDGFGAATDADGDGVIDDPLFVPGMPKLNQAMYNNYENVCVDGNTAYVSCASPNVAQRLLKPPGKICFSNTELAGVDSCIGQPNSNQVTGFYFFGNANDGARFEYTQNDDDSDGDGNSDFRPTMQLECSHTPNKNLDTVFDNSTCNGTQSKVRIHTRYRKVFEGFLSFGFQKLTQPALLPYFFNPNQVGVEGSSNIVGSPGSEVGPSVIKKNGNLETIIPTIKPHKDFRGCYEVDVETNQVSACN